MQNRRFGRLGWSVSEIGFGGWAIGGGWGPQADADSIAALRRAFELGCNFVDTAQVYGEGRSERVIAQALRAHAPAQRVYVATKIPPLPGAWPPSPYDRIEDRYPDGYLEQRVERSLRDLDTDCLDLVQLHTWTRAWNRHPVAFEALRRLRDAGKIAGIGVSSPEFDQNAVVDLMRGGWVDAVQIIYNIFEQEAQAELLPAAQEHDVAVIVRVVFDEGALTGKLRADTQFGEGDFRTRYFAGDRLERTLRRVEQVRRIVSDEEPDLPAAALKFALKPPAVSTVIPGIRTRAQAEANLSVSGQPPMSDALQARLRGCNWRRGDWHGGK